MYLIKLEQQNYKQINNICGDSFVIQYNSSAVLNEQQTAIAHSNFRIFQNILKLPKTAGIKQSKTRADAIFNCRLVVLDCLES